ncbi:MAG: lamin tail domain-containing protein, partial [bacterium]|nr:lamin tail domain-containing protein [bacterium]
MNKRVFVILTSLLAISIVLPRPGHAAPASHIVISEVKLAGATATDEFVELYNPTDAPINLEHYKLQKRTASGSASNLVSDFPALTIAPHGFLLVAHPSGYADAVAPDLVYSTTASLANDNTVILFAPDGTSIDTVGFGLASVAEGTSVPNPEASQSVERKPGGALGSGEDTDINSDDFAVMLEPQPDNQGSAPRPAFTEESASSEEPIPTPFSEETVLEEQPTPSEETTPEVAETPAEDSSETASPETETTADTENQSTESETDASNNTSSETVSIPVTPSPRAPGAGDLLINEIVPNPSAGDEWVEIKNTASEPLALGGMKIRDGSTRSIPLSGTIEPLAYMVVFSSSALFNNSGDTVIIAGGDDTVFDHVSYGDWEDNSVKPAAPGKNQSLARSPDGVLGASFRVSITPTPGAANQINEPVAISPPASPNVPSVLPALPPSVPLLPVAPKPSPIVPEMPRTYEMGSVLITEIFPVPDSGKPEWVEIWNATTSSIDLAGFTLSDARGTRTPMMGTLEANAYHIIEHPRGALNNDGDTVILRDPAETILSEVSYATLRRNEAWAWNGTVWARTTVSTPGLINQFPAEDVEEEETIAAPKKKKAAKNAVLAVELDEVRSLAKGVAIKTSGTVSVPLGVFGPRVFYLDGMQIYLSGSKVIVPDFAIGDILQVEGKTGSIGGEVRIAVSKELGIARLEAGVPPEPEPVDIDGIGDDMEGSLVSLAGTITEKRGERLTFEDENGSISIIIKPKTGINSGSLPIG